MGVRGSTPAPGPEFVRYGGHTSCVALARDGERPAVVLDAGTGLRRLPALLDGEPFRGSILLGHLHWDHTHGLPFTPVIDREDARVDLYIPAQGPPVEVLERWMSPPHFPIGPEELGGEWSFTGIEEGRHTIEGHSVLAREILHKGGRTFGYRVSDGDVGVAYLSDHAPHTLGPGPEGVGEYHEAAVELAAGVDLLVHDAQYTADELATRGHFGHAAAEYAVGLAKETGARRLLLFHHDPNRTDDQLDRLVADLDSRGVDVAPAVEGTTIEL